MVQTRYLLQRPPQLPSFAAWYGWVYWGYLGMVPAQTSQQNCAQLSAAASELVVCHGLNLATQLCQAQLDLSCSLPSSALTKAPTHCTAPLLLRAPVFVRPFLTKHRVVLLQGFTRVFSRTGASPRPRGRAFCRRCVRIWRRMPRARSPRLYPALAFVR